ncbi:hypothetical protein HNQ82_001208 [Anoxybacillus tengchongensis]|uniref:Antigen I/II N-terminal domain-containing protein n=1 Tax=Anoxybacillus tengchongensis TaxID=576944 RepID=A0A7W9YQD4_9BACL|nr:hypothetical protein [Anoxybacillus tengchongensis]MBB6176394.1 hypothetical protein [Anoxybacillus tengchongensis]
MKRIYLITLIFSMFVFLAACGNNNEKELNAAETNASENINKDDSISVDKNLLDVEVTLPASLFEGRDIDEVVAEAEGDGIKEVIKNADGSLTYKMTKAKHKELIGELENGIKKTIDELKRDKSLIVIQDITYNDNFSEFNMSVDVSSSENSMYGLAAIGLGISGMYYQVFNGVKDFKVTVNIKNASTGEILDTFVYPDILNN